MKSGLTDAPGPVFTSARERRLWAWTAAVVVAIFATLGLARTFADAFAGTGLGAVAFVAACLMVLTAVVTRGLTIVPGRAEVAVALGVAAVYLLIGVRMSIPTERSHLVEYGVVALLVREALLERRDGGRSVPVPNFVAFAAAAGLGVVDEAIQIAIPGRVFDPLDIVFNVFAAAMAVAASAAIAWVRRRVA